MENKSIKIGDKVSLGGYIITPADYDSYFTKGEKPCLLPKVIVIGLGTEVVK